jgi:hypothetical protein
MVPAQPEQDLFEGSESASSGEEVAGSEESSNEETSSESDVEFED